MGTLKGTRVLRDAMLKVANVLLAPMLEAVIGPTVEEASMLKGAVVPRRATAPKTAKVRRTPTAVSTTIVPKTPCSRARSEQ